VVKVLLLVLDASDKTTICDASFVLGGIGLSDVLHGVSGGQGLDIIRCTLHGLIARLDFWHLFFISVAMWQSGA
jgi:hypothetical protein